MSATSLSLLLALAPVAQEWTPLELPGLCSERSPLPWLPALTDGAHLHLQRSPGVRRLGPSAELSANQLAQVLESEARRLGLQMLVYSGAPPLLVQGSAADTEWARAFVAGLDQAAGLLEVELDVLLVPTRVAGGGAGDELAPAGSEGRHRARVRSGDEVALGERVHHRFVASYDVEVASNSGIAAPVVGSAFTGATVHLRVARVAAGRRVHVVGLLDLCELRAMEEFHPDSIDLGVVQQPILAKVQVAFSGVVESGGALTVEVAGAPLAQSDWTLVVKATTQADPDELRPGSWRAIDLALLAEPPRLLPAFALGTGLDALATIEAISGASSPISPSALFLRSESMRRGAARGGGASNGIPTERMLLLPADELEAARALAKLTAALESGRIGTARLALESGDFAVRFPVATGEVARVIAGTERTWLVDYDAQIAPDTWMPAPKIESAFDGIVWQARHEGGALEGASAQARTTSHSVRTRKEANMGVLQLPVRSVRTERSRRTPAAEPQVLLEADASVSGLALRFRDR